MKKIISIIFSIIILFLFPINCYADEDDFSSVYDIIPNEVKDTLSDTEYEIDSFQDVIDIISNDGVFALIKVAFSDYSLPFKSVLTLLLIFLALFLAF